MACGDDVVRQFTITEDGEDIVVLQINVGVENTCPVNDLCRLCSKSLRVNGILNNTSLVFARSKLHPKSISDRLEDLGLILKPSKNRSTRVCLSCVRILTRLEGHMEIFRKWKDEEEKMDTEEETESAESPGSGDKRSRSPSPSQGQSKPPEPPKRLCKKLRTEPLPSQQKRKSVTKVLTSYAGRTDVKMSSEREAGIIYNIAHQKWSTAANLLCSHKELFDEMKRRILIGVNDESQSLTNPYNKCMLWKTSPEDIKSFSMDNLISELQQRAPLLWSIFQTITKDNNDEVACVAFCIALRGREPRLSALAYHINTIVARPGIKKRFNKLSQMAITTSYGQATNKQKEMKAAKESATRKETSPELDVSKPLQNPDEEMDHSADPKELGADLENHLALSVKQETSTCLENVT